MPPHIAIVDNNEEFRRLFNFIARCEGWTLSFYSYPEIDLAALEHFYPDLIVLDIGDSSIEQGWDTLQRVQQAASTAAVPLIISTPLPALPGEIQSYAAAHSITVLPKPFGITAFVTLVQQILHLTMPLHLLQTRKLPVLLVEDNPALTSPFMMVMEFEGYLATHVPNGLLALDALQHGAYSLIFLDINMPVMDGEAFLKIYAAQPAPHAPVVIFSAQAGRAVHNLPYFVIGRLLKPYTIKNLLSIVSLYAEPAN